MTKKDELDTKVATLMATVKKKRAEIGGLERPRWTTTCSLELPGFDRINIQVTRDISFLLIALGILQQMESYVTKLGPDLGVDVTPMWKNFKIADWCDDIRLQVRRINIEAEQRKLAKLEKQLTPLLSEEQRRELALAAIEEQL
jgi:hypothetical protein